MKKIALFAALALLCLNFRLKAQQHYPNQQVLAVGQSLPDSIWTKPMSVLNSKQAQILLSDFKGRLLILDFWATWCTACVKKFPLLDSLQREFNEDLQILLVNSSIKGDTHEKIKLRLRGSQLLTIVDDVALKKLFPHQTIPHYVWIDKKGKIFALSDTHMVSAPIIKNILINLSN